MAMVLLQGMAPILAGLAAGIAGALFVSHLIANQLFGVTPWDPLTISGVATLLLIVATSACLIPARRASRTDPLVALRFE
jgi:putative ABC transport system permease protein